MNDEEKRCPDCNGLLMEMPNSGWFCDGCWERFDEDDVKVSA